MYLVFYFEKKLLLQFKKKINFVQLLVSKMYSEELVCRPVVSYGQNLDYLNTIGKAW